MEACAIAMVGNIAMEMECHGLCYARTLERYKEHGMSWVPQVLKRIPARVDGETRKKVLVLVSSVGLSMNRDCVSFEKIKDLLAKLKITLVELQT